MCLPHISLYEKYNAVITGFLNLKNLSCFLRIFHNENHGQLHIFISLLLFLVHIELLRIKLHSMVFLLQLFFLFLLCLIIF